jgi:hypothetical protein
MNYNKQQLREFFNHLYLELEGKQNEQLAAYRQRYGIEMIPQTNDMRNLEYQDDLLKNFKALMPMFKGLLDRMDDVTPEPGKEKVSKTFRRVIKTADYETVEVVNTLEKEVEYANRHERSEQIGALSRRAVDELAVDLNSVCDRLGVSEKRVSAHRGRP